MRGDRHEPQRKADNWRNIAITLIDPVVSAHARFTSTIKK
jgi:hypothetical protein